MRVPEEKENVIQCQFGIFREGIAGNSLDIACELFGSYPHFGQFMS